MLTGILAAVSAVFTAVTAWFAYAKRTAKSPTEKVDEVKADLDKEQQDFKEDGRPKW